MKARIEKKLSKRLVELLPMYKNAWICEEGIDNYIIKPDDIDVPKTAKNMRRYYDGLIHVNNVYHLGGGLDYWGEANDTYTVFEGFVGRLGSIDWSGIFGWHPSNHEFSAYPLFPKKRLTGKQAIHIAKLLIAHGKAKNPNFKTPILHGVQCPKCNDTGSIKRKVRTSTGRKTIRQHCEECRMEETRSAA